MLLRILAIGDVVGQPGRQILLDRLREFRHEKQIDLVIANAENSAHGAGITPSTLDDLTKAGCDVCTGGDHVFDKREIIPLLQRNDKPPRLLRAANLPEEAAGSGWGIYETQSGVKVAVIHLLGRVFMKPHPACPYATVNRFLEQVRDTTPVIVVEVHGEATSEKIAMGWHVDGKVSLVFGTHTHVQTADDRVLPQGTAYITDLGMTGPHDSVLGRRKDRVLAAFMTQMPHLFDVATDDVRMCGAIATIDAETGRAKSIERVQVGGRS